MQCSDLSRLARPSPNIWYSPGVYEIENHAFDRAGHVESTMRRVRDWAGARVLDIGCGTGFHLPMFARRAARVIGVEPHPPLASAARRRLAAAARDGQATDHVEVRAGAAQLLPVPDASIDVVHARWAYFFGPGCEPGLAEIRRVLAPGATAFVLDHDASTSDYGRWFRLANPDYDPRRIERFWERRGWLRHPIRTSWQMESRADFEAVVRIEFEPRTAETLLREHRGTSLEYAVNLWSYTDPGPERRLARPWRR